MSIDYTNQSLNLVQFDEKSNNPSEFFPENPFLKNL